MANSSQARKRARQSEKRRQHNASRKTLLRTRIKQVVSAIEAGDKATAEAAYKRAVPVIDRMAEGELIHKNKAARHKSRLNARIRAM
ncbi:MAG: 30S ribosomal protein S20 [Pseudomonadota bacterium]